MSDLFIELYLDEDVDVLVADLIRARGFSVITTREAGQLGNNDADQLAYAVNRQKTFFTHNRVDFEVLVLKLFRYRETALWHSHCCTPFPLRGCPTAPSHPQPYHG